MRRSLQALTLWGVGTVGGVIAGVMCSLIITLPPLAERLRGEPTATGSTGLTELGALIGGSVALAFGTIVGLVAAIIAMMSPQGVCSAWAVALIAGATTATAFGLFFVTFTGWRDASTTAEAVVLGILAGSLLTLTAMLLRLARVAMAR